MLAGLLATTRRPAQGRHRGDRAARQSIAPQKTTDADLAIIARPLPAADPAAAATPSRPAAAVRAAAEGARATADDFKPNPFPRPDSSR